MGGMGKTALSVKLAEQVQDNFEYLVWRSLRNAPPLEGLVGDIILFLSQQQEVNLSGNLDELLSCLIEYLRQHRCLLILDNVETILRSGERAGRYREGYEGYQQLFERVGDQRHQSCLLLTSREGPGGLGLREDETSPVRSLQLTGLGTEEGQIILTAKGLAQSEIYKQLIDQYGGNPLALKIAATTIRSLFDGDVSSFLEQGTVVFGDIWDLLDQQFHRLTPLEQQVMHWLAINREWMTLAELREDIVPTVSHRELLEALESLQGRSLIEQQAARFTQQPVVMEYMTERLITQFHQEITTQDIRLLSTYALLKAQAKDYVRESQIRVILEPLVQKLHQFFRTKEELQQQLNQTLVCLREQFAEVEGYGGGNLINLLNYLGIDLGGYDFSHLHIWQAYLPDASLQEVNFAHANLRKSVLAENLSSVMALTFTPDGELLATGDNNACLCIWQVSTGQRLLTLQGHTGWIWAVAFSPDGQTLVSGGFDASIRVWNIHTGECLRTWVAHPGGVWGLAFDRQGNVLISGGDDAQVKLWNIHTGECLKRFHCDNDQIHGIDLSPDGQRLVSGGGTSLRIWDLASGECLQSLKGHTAQIQDVKFSPNGQWLVSGGEDHRVRIWDLATGKCLHTLKGHTSGVWSVAFDPWDQTVISGSADTTVRIWDAAMGQCLKQLQGHKNNVYTVVPSPKGNFLASGSADMSVKFWDLQTGLCLKTLQGWLDWQGSIAASPDGRLVANGKRVQVQLWDARSGELLRELHGHQSWVWMVVFSPDGQWLASTSGDHTVKLWDAQTGKCLRTLQGHNYWVLAAAFSPSGNLLASGSGDSLIKLWNPRTGECVKTLEGHTHFVNSVSFSLQAGTNLLASGSDDTTIRLWETTTGQCLKILEGHTSRVWSVALSATENFLASGGGDCLIKLWDITTGECLATLADHGGPVWSVAFSPDGKCLVSGSGDCTIKLWEVSTGQCLKTFTGHTHLVSSVTFKPIHHLVDSALLQPFHEDPGKNESPILVSGSHDTTIKLWDITTGICLQTLSSDPLYKGMRITGIKGVTKAQKATLRTLGAVEQG